MNCALCEGKTTKVISLGSTPPANELLTQAEHVETQDLFELTLTKCVSCNHLQLSEEVPKERLFSNYVYVSDTGEANRKHFSDYEDAMTKRFNPQFVVDIGSNDGLFLSYFSCQVLGVDPAKNIEKKVRTFDDFFTEKTAQFIRGFCGRADLITCNNMFAHNKDLSDVVRGVKLLLDDGGTFVFEVSYALPLLQNALFDLIYHEHFHHWHVSPMIAYFKKFGMKVVDAQEISTHGGSIRVFVQHDTKAAVETEGLHTILEKERKQFMNAVNGFKHKVVINKVRMTLMLMDITGQNKTIGILGYPAKACTMSYYYHLDKGMISDVFDDNPAKIGRYTQTGFKIRPTSDIEQSPPDYLLILSWNYAEALMNKHKTFPGKFILPFPEPKVI